MTESRAPQPARGPRGDDQYLFHVTKAVRGREAATRAKLEEQGWEFVSQKTGTLRTEMHFRRPRPDGIGVLLSRAWQRFRGLAPRTQRVLTIGSGALVAALVVGVTVAVAVGGGDADSPSSTARESGTPNSTPESTPEDLAESPSDETEPAEAASPEASETPSDLPEPSEEASQVPEILTAANSSEFAALLKVPDSCSSGVTKFAKERKGQVVEFDASIAAMSNHDGYGTRYDILVSPGDKGSLSTIGPSFQFRDVNFYDLNLPSNGPGTIGVDDKLHVVAEIGENLRQQCLLLLDPVSTEVRK